MATYDKTILNGHVTLTLKPRTLATNRQIDAWLRELGYNQAPDDKGGIEADNYYSAQGLALMLALCEGVAVQDETIPDMAMLMEFWQAQASAKTIDSKFNLWAELITSAVGGAIFTACIAPNDALQAPPELRVPAYQLEKKSAPNGKR